MTGEAQAPTARAETETARSAEAVAALAPMPSTAIERTDGGRDVAPAPAPPPKPPRSRYAFANDDPNDDFVVAPPEPRADCHDALAAAGVKYTDARIPVHKEGKGRSQLTCGAEQVVYRGSAARIAFEPTLNMAGRL